MIDQQSLAAIRFGYGLSARPVPPGSVADMLARLRSDDSSAQTYPVIGYAGLVPVLQAVAEGRKARREGQGTEMFAAAIKQVRALETQAFRAGFARCVAAPDGFRERLTAFWADHFTTRARNQGLAALPSALVEDAIRPNLSGRFADMLIAATLHPSMLFYLDQVRSVGPQSRFGQKRKRGLNENLAREVMELHSLGVGAGYDQADVRQMAELLTGLDVSLKDGTVFRAARAEPGAEVVLGRSYDGAGLEPIRASLQDLASRPETAAHIARKLAVHFVSDTPDADLVAVMTDRYRATGGDLFEVYAAMLNHPAAWAPELMKVRQPLEFLVAAFRALGVSGDDVMRFADGPLARLVRNRAALMGQPWQRPVGPDGWPEEAAAWITPQGLGARIAWAMEVPGRLVRPMPNPVVFARTALGPAADEQLLWAVSRAESLREGVGLVLASPAFNRR